MNDETVARGPHSLYRHFNKYGALLYVGVAMNSMKRLSSHRYSASWFSEIATVTIDQHETRAAVLIAERKAIQEENPLHNITHKPVEMREVKLPSVGTKKRGRKAISSTEESQTRGLRLLPSQWMKLKRLGGSAWLRSEVNAAEVTW